MPEPKYIPYASKTRKGITYTLMLFEGRYYCNCPGFSRKRPGECPHTDEDRELRRLLNMTNAVAIRDNSPKDVVPEGYQPIEVRPPQERLPSESQYNMMMTIASMAVAGANKANAQERALPVAIKTPEQAMTIMLAGFELGIPPFSALRRLYIVNGRVELETQALMGLVKAGDPTAFFRFNEYTQKACSVTLFRQGEEIITVRYTEDDARQSGQMAKPGTPWRSYTRDMLAYSAVKRACRLGAPELTNQVLPASAEQYGPEDVAVGDKVELANPVTRALIEGTVAPAEVFGGETAPEDAERAESGGAAQHTAQATQAAPARPRTAQRENNPDGPADPRLVERITKRLKVLKEGNSEQTALDPKAYGALYGAVVKASMPEGATRLDMSKMTAGGAAAAWAIVKPEEPPEPEPEGEHLTDEGETAGTFDTPSESNVEEDTPSEEEGTPDEEPRQATLGGTGDFQ